MRARSTANEWGVKCQHCGKWNLQWNERNIGETGIVCEYCRLSINTNDGEWIAARRLTKQITMESFRISQLIVKPVMDSPFKWKELLAKLSGYPTAQLYNEVFGLAYDSGSQPVTRDQLKRCCDERPNTIPDGNSPGIPPLVMGVDWACFGEDSYTFIVVGGWAAFPFKFNVYYWKIFKGGEEETNSLNQVSWIIDTFKKYNIKIIGADWGAGHVQNIHLVNALGEQHVAQLWHTGMGSGGGGAIAQKRAKFEPKTRKWHLNRTAVLTDTFESLRREQIRLPRAEENEILFDHLLAETLEYRERSNREFYTHVQPDDGLHALTFALLAGELLNSGDFRSHQGSVMTSKNSQLDQEDSNELY